jgi:hypothetical protein
VRNPYLERLADTQADASVELRESRRRVDWIGTTLGPADDTSPSLSDRVAALEELAERGFRAPWGISLSKEAPKDEVEESARIYAAIALDERNPARVRADAFYLLRWMPKSARTADVLDAAIGLLRSVSRDQPDAEHIQSRLLASLRRTRPRYDPVKEVFVDYALSGMNEEVRLSAVKGLGEFPDRADANSVLEQIRRYDPSKRVRAMADRVGTGKG